MYFIHAGTAIAFVFGDYVSQLFSLGGYSTSIYAAVAIVLLTMLNIIGLRQSKQLQNWLAVTLILGLLLVILSGLGFSSPVPVASVTPSASTPSWGLAQILHQSQEGVAKTLKV